MKNIKQYFSKETLGICIVTLIGTVLMNNYETARMIGFSVMGSGIIQYVNNMLNFKISYKGGL